MKLFASLISRIDQSNKTNDKIDALVDYFQKAPDDDKVWAIALLSGRRPKRHVTVTKLWQWANELAKIPEWLFQESYNEVGDLSETIALLLPECEETGGHKLSEIMELLKSLEFESEEKRKEIIFEIWKKQTSFERFVFNKFITGSYRIGVSQNLVIRALTKYTNEEAGFIAHRMMGNWSPDTITFKQLFEGEEGDHDISRPYPFFLAYPHEGELNKLGEPNEWQAEWKWDGIRGQIINRKGNFSIWSRGEDLITEKFPEFRIMKDILPFGTVLDGEIMPWKDGPLPFNVLQTRFGRKNVTANVMKNAPVVFIAYDLLEWEGNDVRSFDLNQRREILEELIRKLNNKIINISPIVEFENWNELISQREKAREINSEGIMLKKLSSTYETGRKRGSWWKWKVDPYTVDAVLIYAQKGSGRRASLYTDYTFAVWDGDVLVPFAKAYSGLTDAEIRKVNNYILNNTIEKFGPVRSLKPNLVFEIAFEGINKSTRHKSGVAIRFPRILRWRIDKPASEADSLETLMALL